MNNITVKDVMVPVSEYIILREDRTLHEAMQLLSDTWDHKGGINVHRDLLVEDDTGRITGKVTMMDILCFMEPQYKKISNSKNDHVLGSSFVQKVFKDFNLWSESLGNLCQKAASATIAQIMHDPQKVEFISVESTLDRALHRYIMGVHQPMLAVSGDTVVGVVRLGDIFEKIKQGILSCEI